MHIANAYALRLRAATQDIRPAALVAALRQKPAPWDLDHGTARVRNLEALAGAKSSSIDPMPTPVDVTPPRLKKLPLGIRSGNASASLAFAEWLIRVCIESRPMDGAVPYHFLGLGTATKGHLMIKDAVNASIEIGGISSVNPASQPSEMKRYVAFSFFFLSFSVRPIIFPIHWRDKKIQACRETFASITTVAKGGPCQGRLSAFACWVENV